MVRSASRLLRAAAVLAAFVLIPSAASAGSIDFRGVGKAAAVSISGVRTGSFMAGELNWLWVGAAPEGFAQSFYSYCVDVAHNLGDPQEVGVRSTAGFTNGVIDGGAKAAWLFNEFAAGIRSATDSVANTRAAALQIAIWEAMYDSTANLSGGSFILNTSGAIRTQAQTYLSALYIPGTTNYHTSLATVLDVASPTPGQDQIVARVSEPSTILMMGVAFFVFAKRFRRPTSVVD